MLGSDYDGERAVAGRMASELLRQHKLTWADVLGADGKAVIAPRVRVWHEPKNWGEAAAECAAWPEILTTWEVDFLKSVSGRRQLSERQAQCLVRVVGKCRAYARASGATFT